MVPSLIDLINQQLTPEPATYPEQLAEVDSSIRNFRYGIEQSRQRVALATGSLVDEHNEALRVEEALRTIVDKIRRD